MFWQLHNITSTVNNILVYFLPWFKKYSVKCLNTVCHFDGINMDIEAIIKYSIEFL